MRDDDEANWGTYRTVLCEVCAVIAIAAIFIALAALVTGCTFPAVQQPRALQLGAVQPVCVMFCWSTATSTDAEGQGNASTAQQQDQHISVGVQPRAVTPPQ